LACGIHLSDGEPPSKASIEYCQQLIEKYGARSLSSDKGKNTRGVHVADVLWSTRFFARATPLRRRSSKSSEAAEVKQNHPAPACLIGDDAHIHPLPAGKA
jgi:hypothetical protein